MSTVSLLAIAITIILNNAANPNSTCEQDNAACVLDATCNATFNAYIEACSDVFENVNLTFTYNEGQCPDDCQAALSVYLEQVYPNEISTDFCNCGAPDCEAYLQQLYDQRCIASDCAALYMNCQNDTNCKPLADEYLMDCAPLFENFTIPYDYNFCPTGCQDALGAYVNYIAPNFTTLRFCDCNGDAICEQYKDRLESVDCISTDCYTFFGDCLANPTCEPIANQYVEDCGALFNGSWAMTGNTWCPTNCKSSYQAFINAANPDFATTTDWCTCTFPECQEGLDALYQYGCIANDCALQWMTCYDDPTCMPTAESYLNACEMIINGTWDEDWCPTDCSYWLQKYINIALTNLSYYNPLDYCDCNGESNCIEGQSNLINAGCFAEGCEKLQATKCETNPSCMGVFTEYIEACESVFNGSWTNPWCPTECQGKLFEYLTFIAPPNADLNQIDSICSCPADSDCQQYTDNLKNSGCFQENCGTIWHNCQNNPSCQPIAEQYLSDCESIINRSYTGTTCPGNCMESLAAYLGAASGVGQVVSGEFCDCEGVDFCQDILDDYVTLGCIPENCEFQYGVCVADPICKEIADDYIEACTDVIELTTTATTCPQDCLYALTTYVDYVYASEGEQDSSSDYCQCADDNTNCEDIQQKLDDLGCIDFNDCQFTYSQCIKDPDCKIIADGYFALCNEFINQTYVSGTYSQCPVDCSDGLKAYVAAVWPDQDSSSINDYCNCNSDSICTTITTWYNELDCLADLTTLAPVTSTTTGATPTPFANQSKTSTFNVYVSSLFVVVIIKLFFM